MFFFVLFILFIVIDFINITLSIFFFVCKIVCFIEDKEKKCVIKYRKSFKCMIETILRTPMKKVFFLMNIISVNIEEGYELLKEQS
jgi:hypothetical protein